MEIFIDFGLFEVLAALGLATLAKAVYTHKTLGPLFLILCIGLPTASIFVAQSEASRWLSVLCLATTLVNAVVVAGGMQRGDVPTLRLPRRPWNLFRPKKRQL